MSDARLRRDRRKATLFVDCGAAETRFAVYSGANFLWFDFAPALGDPLDAEPLRHGERVAGVVRQVVPALAGAFVDVGADRDAFLPLDIPLAEGAWVTAVVARAAMGAKGATLRGAEREAGISNARPGRIDAPCAAALRIFERWQPDDFDAVIVNDAGAAATLRAAGAPEISIDADRLAAIDIEFAIEASLERTEPLPGGGSLILDETEGGVFIDVDAAASAASGQTRGRAVDALNIAAAEALFGALSRRALSGRIIIDFPAPAGPPARRALADALARGAAACARALPKARLGRVAVDGLADLTVARRGPSLLARAGEPAAQSDDALRAGVRARLDWTAKRAVAALERRLSRNPQARFTLEVGAALDAYLDGKDFWFERLAARWGARATRRRRDDLDPRERRLVEDPR